MHDLHATDLGTPRRLPRLLHLGFDSAHRRMKSSDSPLRRLGLRGRGRRRGRGGRRLGDVGSGSEQPASRSGPASNEREDAAYVHGVPSRDNVSTAESTHREPAEPAQDQPVENQQALGGLILPLVPRGLLDQIEMREGRARMGPPLVFPLVHQPGSSRLTEALRQSVRTGTRSFWPAERAVDSSALSRSISVMMPRTSPSVAMSLAMPHSVSPGATWTISVGSG